MTRSAGNPHPSIVSLVTSKVYYLWHPVSYLKQGVLQVSVLYPSVVGVKVPPPPGASELPFGGKSFPRLEPLEQCHLWARTIIQGKFI